MVRLLLPILLLSACSGGGSSSAGNDQKVDLPEPSGPPMVQQVDNKAEPAAPAKAK